MNVLIKILAIILLVLLILLVGSILYLQFNDPRVIMDQNDLEENKVLVMTKNDEASYIRLSNYFSEHNYQDFLAYSLKMSNSMEIANYYFFETYMGIRITKNYKMEDFVKLDKAERYFLLYMLEKGARAGDSYSAEKLIYLYRHGVGVDINVTKADSLQKVINSFIEN
ncbi:MAG: hypothetical protein IPN79_10855 [Saprospiraceae bacterium]|nr:hypothetical protein [Saprospiraceae bacterium]